MSDYEPGTVTVTVSYDFVCALCEYGDYMALVADKKDAEKRMREGGWSKTIKHGWICPGCKERLRGAL